LNLNFVQTQLNSAKFSPLDEPFFECFFLSLKMCGGFLASGSDGGAPDALLLPHAAAFISACRIKPQVPPTAKRAKRVVRRRCPP
jgi:hypothetical protein